MHDVEFRHILTSGDTVLVYYKHKTHSFDSRVYCGRGTNHPSNSSREFASRAANSATHLMRRHQCTPQEINVLFYGVKGKDGASAFEVEYIPKKTQAEPHRLSLMVSLHGDLILAGRNAGEYTLIRREELSEAVTNAISLLLRQKKIELEIPSLSDAEQI